MVQATPTTQSAATATHSGDGAAGGKDGGGEDLTVQQILMPPDPDFLSSFYEAAQVREEERAFLFLSLHVQSC